jgi:MoxR-like ATPase
MKTRKKGKSSVVVVSPSIEVAVDTFTEAFSPLKQELVDRLDEIEAIKLCILTKQHLLLEGLWGTAKSLLASKAFSRIGGDVVIFRHQFMKETQVDEVYGPMNSEKYRQEAVWEYNTKGKLPEAHFAFLDEVYRASDSLLPSMMSILNERIFHNGGEVISCPLITAVGTSNQVTESADLEAFHDRWLIRLKVKPLASSASRLTMLSLFLDGLVAGDKKTLVSLEELEILQRAVLEVRLPVEILSLFEEVASTYCRNTQAYISDRRLCLALRLIQAGVLLYDNPAKPDPSVIGCARFALVQKPVESYYDAFDNALTKVVGDYRTSLTEEPIISGLERVVSRYRSRYDSQMPQKEALKLLEEAESLKDQIKTPQGEFIFTLSRNIARLETCKTTLFELITTLAGAHDQFGDKTPPGGTKADEILSLNVGIGATSYI